MNGKIFTLRNLYQSGTEKLEKAGIREAKLDAWYLLEYKTGISRAVFLADPDREVEEEKAESYQKDICTRARRIPLQHITGSQEFMGLDFKVNEDVLIPRQDTELLVENAITYIKSVKGNVDVLDMCTGSGCIAISIDRLCENAKVTAVDFSEKALVVAKENNTLNKADVTFFQSDLFENVEKQYDVIVSNPPYIKTEEIESLMDEVRIHEPMMALDGDCDGLKFYKKIAKEGRQYLRSNGIIFFEIGYDQGQTVPAILEENGYKDIKVYKDLSGNDRVVTAGKE